MDAVARRQRGSERSGRIENGLAIERVGVIDRLDLDKRCAGLAVRAIARMVATGEICPCRSRNARSGSLASRWTSEKAMSPPRISRPSRASPLARLSANEPTPAIAMTPSAIQATKIRKPCKPPRNSRSARRSGSHDSPLARALVRAREAESALMRAYAPAHPSRCGPSAAAPRGRSARQAPCHG